MTRTANGILIGLGCFRSDRNVGLQPKMCNSGMINAMIEYLKTQKQTKEIQQTILDLKMYLNTHSGI
jgi:hypothetical protein